MQSRRVIRPPVTVSKSRLVACMLLAAFERTASDRPLEFRLTRDYITWNCIVAAGDCDDPASVAIYTTIPKVYTVNRSTMWICLPDWVVPIEVTPVMTTCQLYHTIYRVILTKSQIHHTVDLAILYKFADPTNNTPSCEFESINVCKSDHRMVLIDVS